MHFRGKLLGTRAGMASLTSFKAWEEGHLKRVWLTPMFSVEN